MRPRGTFAQLRLKSADADVLEDDPRAQFLSRASDEKFNVRVVDSQPAPYGRPPCPQRETVTFVVKAYGAEVGRVLPAAAGAASEAKNTTTTIATGSVGRARVLARVGTELPRFKSTRRVNLDRGEANRVCSGGAVLRSSSSWPIGPLSRFVSRAGHSTTCR